MEAKKHEHKKKLNMIQVKMKLLQIDIIGISKLRWTGMGSFQIDNYMIDYLGHKKQRRNS